MIRYFLYLFVLWLFGAAFLRGADRFSFRVLSMEDGLSSSKIECILQDEIGFIWIGTRDGLNRFDGREFKIFRPPAIDSYPVLEMIRASDGKFLIAAGGRGIWSFDPRSSRFEKLHGQRRKDGSGVEVFLSIQEGANGEIWAGTTWSDLIRVDRESGVTQHFPLLEGENLEIGSIHRLEDVPNSVWVAARKHGLFEIDSKTAKILHRWPEVRAVDLYGRNREEFLIGAIGDGIFDLDEDGNPKLISGGSTQVVLRDRSGQVWRGAPRHGLRMLDPESESGEIRIQTNPKNPYSIPNDAIRCLYEDRSGLLWIGTANGLCWTNPGPPWFQRLRFDNEVLDPRSSNMIHAIAPAGNGEYWVGEDTGVKKVKLGNEGLTVTSQPENIDLTRIVVSLAPNKQPGRVWAASFGRLFDWAPGEIAPLLDPLPVEPLQVLHNDRNETLWVGTSKGLFKLSKGQSSLTAWPITKGSEAGSNPYSNILALFSDSKENLWVGGTGFIARLDPETSSPEDTWELKLKGGNSRVLCFFEDAKANLWAGTYRGLFQLVEGEWKRIFPTSATSQHPKQIMSIRESRDGNLWLATENGIILVRDSPGAAPDFQWIKSAAGFPIRGFSAGQSCVTPDGDFLLPSPDGIIRIRPDLLPPLTPPPLAFTGLKLLNVPVLPGKDGPLSSNIEFTRDITLTHDQNQVITFQFAALDFTAPGDTQFVHRLKGLEEDFSTPRTINEMTYSTLKSGDYTFEVKGTGTTGVWNEKGISMGVTILPPWWETWWARLGFGGSLFAFALAWFRIKMRSIKQHNRELRNVIVEKEIAEGRRIEAEQQLRKQRKKLEHVSRIATASELTALLAHEIRQPLAAILCNIDTSERILKKDDLDLKEFRELLSEIEHDGHRLESIVSRLQDLYNHEPVARAQVDINELIRNGVNYCRSEIPFPIETNLADSPPNLVGDPTQLEQGIINLLSNAIQASQENGTDEPIQVTTQTSPEEIQITVRDHGPGIEDPDEIFETFFSTKEQGMGMGLSLVKAVAQSMDGRVRTENNEDGGASFHLYLPLGDGGGMRDPEAI